jgi:SSS family transporter
MATILSEGIGYFVLLGVGLFMALVVTLLVKAETKWLGTRKTSEWFSTAGRNIKTGLIASSVVSAWTWAATLLQSSTVAYQFGISGPFWYAAGASIQVILFAIVAIELKRKAPSSHTFLEFINMRYGHNAHKVLLFFALMTNTIVTAMLVLGGAAVVNALTGVNILVAAFLIPIGVIIYTFFGGLKATFFADYLNSTFLFVVILIFVTAIYFSNSEIGGISGLFDKLVSVANIKPVEGNVGGVYLTMASTGALVFGIINIVGNFGTVFIDQAYWQRAIATRPKSAIHGFLIGGLAWFSIPFALATTLGLAGLAVGLQLSPQEIGSGLVAPFTASHLLGDVGAILILTMLFTAVTSAGSAELVAVSSLLTYDIYRTYKKPSATGRELMNISRLSIVTFGLGMGILALILFEIGVSLQYVYLAMGILIGSAVAPVLLALIWSKTNRTAATIGAVLGLICGVGIWLLSADILFGNISLMSTGQNIPLLVGNLTSISIGAIVTIAGSLLKPERFNFSITRQKIHLVDERIRSMIKQDSDELYLQKIAKFGYRYAIIISLTLVVAWPLPLYFSGYIFSYLAYLTWVIVALVWTAVAAGVIIFKPLIEARRGIQEIIQKMSIGLKRRLDINTYNDFPTWPPISQEAISKRILVAVDGSIFSLHALDYANRLFDEPDAMLYVIHVIEWTEEDDDESFDSELTKRMEQEGRKMLTRLLLSKKVHCERIVKIGDPGTKIADTANKLDVDIIFIGVRGLGGTSSDMGHVTKNIMGLTSKPVVLVS